MSFWLCLTSVIAFIGLACYAGNVANNQISTISQSVAAKLHNRIKLQNQIVSYFSNDINNNNDDNENEFLFSLVTNRNNVMIKLNMFKHVATLSDMFIICPASHTYEMYLKSIMNMTHPPLINNIFLFAGNHGLGKSYAGLQLGKAFSRFADTVVVSLPMNKFDNFNDVGEVIETIEQALNNKCFVIWTFDELDTYVLQSSRTDLRDKTITQFAEYTGFVKRYSRRILVFTTNNAEFIKHDYWADSNRILNDSFNYEHIDDFNKAINFLSIPPKRFLQEGQLSRLHSFVGNKLFLYNNFNKTVAIHFSKLYLSKYNIDYTNNVELQLFERLHNSQYNVRELKIVLDDIVNAAADAV
ncbi:hypothetical protein [Ectropis obliqua nucleopolyhedrovirus]|nr:hypothetical protein EONV_gp107 [Ectropis obliqua nucleopolyhedrovirus]ABI35790.1 hypothetical protein [Ectropis obliqua nucleopolyhedrovirus]